MVDMGEAMVLECGCDVMRCNATRCDELIQVRTAQAPDKLGGPAAPLFIVLFRCLSLASLFGFREKSVKQKRVSLLMFRGGKRKRVWRFACPAD